MIVRRQMEEELLDAAQQYPVVTLTGPRQSGKTVLVKKVFPDKPYCSLENPDTLALAETDPHSFLEQYPNGAILDEIQRLPMLLSYIQGIVDDRQESGMFILTGSQQLGLVGAVAQSLAGRTAMLKLLPFTLAETKPFGLPSRFEEAALKGFYPRIYDKGQNPTKAYAAYFQTYVERDVRQIQAIRDLKPVLKNQ